MLLEYIHLKQLDLIKPNPLETVALLEYDATCNIRVDSTKSY